MVTLSLFFSASELKIIHRQLSKAFGLSSFSPGYICATKLETIKASEEAGVDPDFYMYTVNKVGYLSSEPEEIGAYMEKVAKPWIGFKVLGAGRDRPPQGFKHAFQKGADFICVGMFDWQVRDDVRLVKQMLEKGIQRPRAWA